jgi:hypothetical protein
MLPLTGPRRRRRAGFRRHPQFILQRYRDSSPGHQDPHAVARSREVVRIADLGREEKKLSFNSYDLFSLNNVKPMRLYKCAKWQNIIVIRANPIG